MAKKDLFAVCEDRQNRPLGEVKIGSSRRNVDTALAAVANARSILPPGTWTVGLYNGPRRGRRPEHGRDYLSRTTRAH